MNLSKVRTTYFGQKGYTVLKKDFTEAEIKKILEDLTAKPLSGSDNGKEISKLRPKKKSNSNILFKIAVE